MSDNYNNNYSNYYQGNGYGQGGGYGYYGTQPEKPKKEKKGTGRFFGKIIVAALVFGVIAGGTAFGVYKGAGIVTGTPTGTASAIIEGTGVSTAVTVTDVSDIAENNLPAIVQVTNLSVTEVRDFFGQIYRQQGKSAGSGIIVAQDNSYIYIASNSHVVSNSNEITINFSTDEAVKGELQGSYPEEDVAVIKVKISDITEDTLNAIKVAVIGDSDKVQMGEPAIVIGNSLGQGQSVTTGCISALERQVSLKDDDGKVYQYNLMQTDATINHGNSGGALFNIKGELIGIVNSKYSGTDVEGTGFAIPINRAHTIITQLITDGKVTGGSHVAEEPIENTNGTYLGIGGRYIDSITASGYNIPTGIYIQQIYSDSAAQAAGLEEGDVIISIDGMQPQSMVAFQNAIASHKPGDKVSLKIAKASRSYMEETITVELGQNKM